MLRNKAGSDSLPVVDRRRLKFEQQEPGWDRRFSWAAGLEGMDQEGGGSESAYGGSERGKEREFQRDRPSAKVVHALKISGPSPVQEELKEEIPTKEFKELSINTACSVASGSGSSSRDEEGSGSGSSSGGTSGDGGEGFREELEKKHKRASTQSQNGTWPRGPGSFPRLSFTPKSPKSPSNRVTPGTPRTPGGRSMKGYF